MSRLFAVIVLASVSLLALTACGDGDAPTGAIPVVDQTGVIDQTGVVDVDDPQVRMEAYIALMIDLRDTLANVGNPDASGDPLNEAIAIGHDIADFTPFFASLSERVMVSLLEVYGTQMQTVNAEVAEHAVRVASTMTGTEELIAVLQMGPAFAIASTTTAPDREVIQGLDPVQ